MINRPYMMECNATRLATEIVAAGLVQSEEGGVGRFYGVESFGVHVVVYLADDITTEEEDIVRATVESHVPV